MTSVPSAFKRLVQLIGRAFYSGECPPRDPDATTPVQPKRKSQQEGAALVTSFEGLGVVALDALTRREWVLEDTLAEEVKVHPKHLRKALRYLEQEQLLAREHRRETQRSRKKGALATAVAAPAEALEAKETGKVISYCSIDYPRLVDVARLRLYKLRKTLKEAVQDRDPIQEYLCPKPGCGQTFSSLEALRLVDFATGEFKCEVCGSVLQQKVGGDDGEAGDELARRRRRDAMRQLQVRMEQQLRPLFEALVRIKDAPIPDFGPLQAWAHNKAAAEQRQQGQGGPAGSGRGGGHHRSGAALYGIDEEVNGETNVRVEMEGADGAAAAANGRAPEARKAVPHWLRRDGDAATATASTSGTGTAITTDSVAWEEDSKAGMAEGVQPPADVQAAYVKAYLEAVRQQQARAATQQAGQRTTGMKADPQDAKDLGTTLPKAEKEEEEDELEWMEAAPVKRVKTEGAWHGGLPAPATSAPARHTPPGGAPSAMEAAAGAAAPDAEEADMEWEDV